MLPQGSAHSPEHWCPGVHPVLSLTQSHNLLKQGGIATIPTRPEKLSIKKKTNKQNIRNVALGKIILDQSEKLSGKYIYIFKGT